MEQKKRIPIGVDDFKDLVEGNYYFADKSLLIKEILESGAKVTLIPRPRRFGKTLNLSMLRYFFEKAPSIQPYGPLRVNGEEQFESKPIHGDDPTSSAHTECFFAEKMYRSIGAAQFRRPLFNDLKIEQYPDCMQEQGKYPIIWLTFKDVKTPKWEDCYRLIKEQISSEFERHIGVVEFLSDVEKKRFERIRQGSGDLADFMRSLLDLSAYLERAYKTRVIILIDEYDAPIHAGYLNGYYDEVVSFMRVFMGAGLKGNSALNFGVMTGILRVAKESIFSGLNNLEVCTLIQDRYSDKFGFLEDEVKTMLTYFGLENHLDEVRQWYNGYQSGNYKVYNPWSIINLVKNTGSIQAYWVNTSDNALIKNLLKTCSPEMKEELEVLMNGGSVKKLIQENIVMTEIEKNDEVLWNFLLFCGYLTFENYRREERSIFADFKIPNEEVFLSYETSFRNWFIESSGVRDYQRMLESLVEGHAEEFKKAFERFSRTTLSYFDVRGDEPERFYHALVLGMLSSLSSSHEVRSNRESGWGRYDVMLIPKNRSKTGLVIEFKNVDQDTHETLESAAQSALKQIEEKQYEVEMHALGLMRILKVGISFKGKESCVLIG